MKTEPGKKTIPASVFEIPKGELRPIRKQFTTIAPEEEQVSTVEKSSSIQEKLDNARLRELSFKHIFRICFSIFSAALLVWQNSEVFTFVHIAFNSHELQNLQPIIATVVGATLIETYFILRIIVNFVFSTSDYKYQDRQK